MLPKQVDSNFCPSLYLSFEPFISNYSGVLEEDHSVCTAARKIFLFFAASCPWDDRFLLTAYLLLVSDQLCYKNVVKPFLVKIQFYAPSVSNLSIVTDPIFRSCCIEYYRIEVNIQCLTIAIVFELIYL